MERAWKAKSSEISPSCPRCGCSNTKFCYYNNYSLSQPRYFCKGCRRYWTKGGSLRNVPVGGGCRKTRRAPAKPALPVSHRAYNSHVDSSAVDGAGDDSHIDLALVYANFLTQKPDLFKAAAGHGGVSELGCSDSFDHHPSLEFPVNNPTDQRDHPSTHEQILFYGLESSFGKPCHDDRVCTGDFGVLPPLPGQEEALVWSSSHEMMVGQAAMHGSEALVLPLMAGPHEAEDHHHDHHQEEANLLTGNCWSPFDLPSDHDAFSGCHEKL